MKLTVTQKVDAFNKGTTYMWVQDQKVKVDAGLLPYIVDKTWHILYVRGIPYVRHSYREGEKVKALYLHEFITGFPVVGWRNNNTLDCTLDNMYNKSKIKVGR